MLRSNQPSQSPRTLVDGHRWGDLSGSIGAEKGEGEGDIVRNAHSAVDLGDLNCLEQLVVKDKSIISSVYGVEGWTLLHRACHRGFLEIVKYLLENGADPMVKDTKGWSMLHCALMSRSKSTLDILMLFLQRPNTPHQVFLWYLYSICLTLTPLDMVRPYFLRQYGSALLCPSFL